MKKLFAVLVALALVLSMGTMALAAGSGTITIKNAVPGATYNVYKMLDFTPSEQDVTKGIYTIPNGTDWDTFIKSPFGGGDIFDFVEEATNKTIVSLKDGAEITQDFAKNALSYATAEGINVPVAATKTADSSGTVTFTGLDLGYYVIDTSLGTLCALTNTNSDFTAVEKNAQPEIDKYVQEDSNSSWGEVNDANIGQTVNYKSTITVGYGVTNYVMHDTMTEGLTFDANSVKVTVDGNKIEATDGIGTNYTVNTNVTHGSGEDAVTHTFDIVFDDSFIGGLAKGTEILVEYSATLNENAKVAEEGNDNTVYLSYGEDTTFETIPHKTRTYTWKMDVFKFTKDGDTEIALSGATFQLFDEKNSVVSFADVTAEGGVPTYKVVAAGAAGALTSITTNESGTFEIIGLDEGAYRLSELTPPTGYNKLDEPVDVTITSTYTDTAKYDTAASFEVDPSADDGITVKVENNTGTLLPETGGIGTTIFYVVGGLLMAAALIVLVSKKRMSSFA